jgi:hypothetical protein
VNVKGQVAVPAAESVTDEQSGVVVLPGDDSWKFTVPCGDGGAVTSEVTVAVKVMD